MNKYLVQGTMEVSCWTIVEAESEEEALREAQDRAVGDTFGADEYKEWAYDGDGAPENLSVRKTR